MLGAIIGDIVGSIHEWQPIKTKNFNLFHPRRYFTDDSVCTAAVADILLHDLPPAETMQEWCRRHPGRGYGGFFGQWIFSDPETLWKLRQRCRNARLASRVSQP